MPPVESAGFEGRGGCKDDSPMTVKAGNWRLKMETPSPRQGKRGDSEQTREAIVARFAFASVLPLREIGLRWSAYSGWWGMGSRSWWPTPHRRRASWCRRPTRTRSWSSTRTSCSAPPARAVTGELNL